MLKPPDRPLPDIDLATVKRDRAARAIVLAWRRLTSPARAAKVGPGAPTLVACSGGADSTALVLALTASRAPIFVAHVVHDLRSEREALADRDAVARLAEQLGVPFCEARVKVRDEGGNAEAAARRLRYAALAELAVGAGVRYIATAHHAGDQAETLLMHLLRGTGPRGLRGISAQRLIAQRLRGEAAPRLIRPMLEVTADDARRVCTLAGVPWQEDATNADTSRLRAALRHRVLPLLEEIRPGATRRMAGTTRMHRAALDVLNRLVVAQAPGAGVWDRSALRSVSSACLGLFWREVVRTRAASEQAPVRGGVRRSQIEALTRYVRSSGTQPRTFRLGPLGVRADAHHVRLEGVRAEPAGPA